MSKETGITKQDVTILKAYSSEFEKLPAKKIKFQKTMETTEKLLMNLRKLIILRPFFWMIR